LSRTGVFDNRESPQHLIARYTRWPQNDALNRARALSLILLAGSIARHRAEPALWDGEDERQLALERARWREKPTGHAGTDRGGSRRAGSAALASDISRCSGLTAPTARAPTAGTLLRAVIVAPPRLQPPVSALPESILAVELTASGKDGCVGS